MFIRLCLPWVTRDQWIGLGKYRGNPTSFWNSGQHIGKACWKKLMVSYGKTRRCSCRLSLHPIRGKEGLSQLQLEKEMRFQLYGPAFNVQGMLHESRTMPTLQNLWQQILKVLKTMQLSKLSLSLHDFDIIYTRVVFIIFHWTLARGMIPSIRALIQATKRHVLDLVDPADMPRFLRDQESL